MLQPIKSTQATQATEATEASDAVRPISEQRPGQTLRDRLYKMPEIPGATKPSASGNEKSLFQKYSIAKTLPAVPLAAAATTAAPGTFSSFVNKFSTFNDFWSGLSAYQKPESQKQFISDKHGTAYISPELMPYANKYGLSKGTKFLEDLYRADRTADARKNNPYYQPIALKDAKEYWSDVEALNLTHMDKTGPEGKGREYRGEIGGINIKLNEGEIGTLRKIAEDNMLGQSGFEELLDRAYKTKAADAMGQVAPRISEALTNPYETDWTKMSQDLSFKTIFRLDDFGIGSDEISKMASNPFSIGLPDLADKYSGVVGDIASQEGLGAYQKGGSFGSDAPGGGWMGALGAAMTIAKVISAVVGQKELGNLAEANFTPVKNGRLAQSIEDYSGSEKDNIRKIAKLIPGMNTNDVVQALSAMQVSALYSKAKTMESLHGKYTDEAKTDKSLLFSDSGIELSRTHNPYGGKNV